VLVRHEGEILAKYSNESKFTSPEWLAKLEKPVQNAPARKTSTTGKKKRRKKKK
jgi:hypothetical protein